MSFEECLIHRASPTLANIKVAELYNFKSESFKECTDTIRDFNASLNPKGIYIELLKKCEKFYLIYVYRKSHLQSDLKNKGIQCFLEEYGYPHNADTQGYLNVLKNRLNCEKGFPHEIGVFLGYPLDDVRSFILTGGKDCVLCGEWKVYHNEESARCTFCKYKRCREIYTRVYSEGRKLSDMLVSA